MADDRILRDVIAQRMTNRRPTALQFNQDRPYDTLASFGPALATRGANDLNQVQNRATLDAAQGHATDRAGIEANADTVGALLKNLPNFPPELLGLAVSGNPGLAEALGLGNFDPAMIAALIPQVADAERAESQAAVIPDVGKASDAASQAGLDPGDFIGTLLQRIGGGKATPRAGGSTRVQAAGAGKPVTYNATDKRTVKSVGTGEGGRPTRIEEQSTRSAKGTPAQVSQYIQTYVNPETGEQESWLVRDGVQVKRVK